MDKTEATKRTLEKPEVRDYGSMLAVTLNTKAKPGDGVYAHGKRGGGS